LVIALPVPPSHQSTNTIPERSPTGMRNWVSSLFGHVWYLAIVKTYVPVIFECLNCLIPIGIVMY
jgi:hypothetical protein